MRGMRERSFQNDMNLERKNTLNGRVAFKCGRRSEGPPESARQWPWREFNASSGEVFLFSEAIEPKTALKHAQRCKGCNNKKRYSAHRIMSDMEKNGGRRRDSRARTAQRGSRVNASTPVVTRPPAHHLRAVPVAA